MRAAAIDRSAALQPLERLYEAPELPAFDLPGALAAAYGGSLGFTEPRLYANFVSSVDGVTAIPGQFQSSHLIAAGSEADRFVMGLLRACADAVLIGAGTLRGSPEARWTAEHAHPPAAELYADLRRARGRPPQPTLAVLSGTGSIDPRHPGLDGRTLVLTSEQGAARLRRRLNGPAAIVPIAGTPQLEPAAAVEALRAGGHEMILCEGGPTVFGTLVEARLVDELFLTLSPLLAGRSPQRPRLALVENATFLPDLTVAGRLLSIRRSRSHLFLRYALPTPELKESGALNSRRRAEGRDPTTGKVTRS
jgi:riboflavin biosynthesis pyrimidine reductase